MFRKQLLAAIGGLAVAGSLALSAGVANASVAVTPDGVGSHLYYTDTNVNPVSGYFATEPLGGDFTHIDSYIGSNDSASLSQLTDSSDGALYGAGIGLCDRTGSESDALAAQIGVVYNGNGTISVDYGFGALHPDTTDNGDPCEAGAVNPTFGALDPALNGIAESDTVVVQLLYSSRHGFTGPNGGCHRGQIEYAAEDLTTDPGIWYSQCVRPDVDEEEGGLSFNEADAGVVDATTNVSAPADNYLATFAHIGLTDTSGNHGSFQADSAWTVYPVDSTGTGHGPDTLALLHADSFAFDHFNEWIGSPTG